MSIPVAFDSERFVAEVALEGAFAGVSSHVGLQVEAMHEAFAAVLAGDGFFGVVFSADEGVG